MVDVDVVLVDTCGVDKLSGSRELYHGFYRNGGGITVPSSNKDSDDTSSSKDSTDDGDDPYIISPEDSKWDEEVTAKMVQYLGGNILPYVNLGGSITVNYKENDKNDDYRSYLTLTGSNFVADRLKDAKKEYDAYDWTSIVYKDEGFYASREAQGLEISVASNAAGLAVLTAYWTEAWDDTTITEWKDVTITGFKNRLGAFYNIPFVYLGTTDYTTSYAVADSTAVKIVGGRYYDDNVYDSFTESFENAGWKVETSSEDATQLVATYTYANGTVLTATLSQYQKRAQIVIGISEAFDKTNNNVWTEAILNSYAKLTTEKLPYVYLGTVYPQTVNAESNTRKLTIKGGLWDDSIFTDAEATFLGVGWTKITADSSSTEDDSDANVQFTITRNKVTYTATLTKVSNGDSYYPKLSVSMAEEFDPTTISDWTSEIKSAFNSKFNDSMDDILPFIYLGTSAPSINTTYSKDDKLVINGGVWNESGIGASFDEALSDWTQTDGCVKGSSTNYNDSKVQKIAFKTFEDSTYKVGLFTLYSGSDKTTYLEITKSFKDTSITTTDWDANTKTLINNYFADIEEETVIPYSYTGKSSGGITFDSSSSYGTGKLKLDPSVSYGTMNYVAMSMYDSLSKANWSVSLKGWSEFSYSGKYYECSLYGIEATKVFGDSTVELSLYFDRINSSTKAVDVIYDSTKISHIGYEEIYDDSNPAAGWGESLDALIKEKFNFTLPYFYLGTKHHYYEYNEATNQLVIYGNKWTDYNEQTKPNASKSPIVMNARAALTSELGFTVNNSTTYSTDVNKVSSTVSAKVQFSCTASNGSSVTIKVSNGSSSNYNGGAPKVTISTSDNNFYDGSATEWSDSVKAVLDANLETGMSLPFIYLGTDNPTVTAKEAFDDMTILQFVGSTYNDYVIDTAKEQLDQDGGWTITTNKVDHTKDKISYLTAYKIYDNNTALRVFVTGGTDGTTTYSTSDWSSKFKDVTKCSMIVIVDKSDTTGTQNAWSSLDVQKNTSSSIEKMSDVMDKKFNNVDIPDFLYLSSDASFEKTSSYSESADTANKFLKFELKGTTTQTKYLAYRAPYIYQTKTLLENDGYEVNIAPFTGATQPKLNSTYKYKADTYTVPSLLAKKTLDTGEKVFISIFPALSTYLNAQNAKLSQSGGYSVVLNYLDSFDNNTETQWGESLSKNGKTIGDLMTDNGLPALPYLNFGTPSSEISALYYENMSALRMTAYNYCDADRLESIKKTMENAGWSMEYRQYYSTSNTGYFNNWTNGTSATSLGAYKSLCGNYTDPTTGQKFVFEMLSVYNENNAPTGTSTTSLFTAKTEVLYGKYVI